MLFAFIIRLQLGIICCVLASHKRSSGFIDRYQQKNPIQPKTECKPPHRENRTFLGYHTASSGNFLPTFRDNLSAPSSGVKNPHRASAKPVLRPKHADTKSLNLLCVFYEYRGVSGDHGSTVVKVLYYKSEGSWFDPSCYNWNFSLT